MKKTIFFLSFLQVKCDQYWPNRGTETYGMIQVTLLDTMELATFCVRTFSLHKVSSGDSTSSFRHFDLTTSNQEKDEFTVCLISIENSSILDTKLFC